MKILLVEDEDDLRFLLTTALEVGGHEVIQAADGGAALSHVAAPDVDLVLLDIRLPDIDGFEVLAGMDAAARRRTVMMSAHGDAELASRAVEAGCAAYLPKPFRLEELRSIIDDFPIRQAS